MSNNTYSKAFLDAREEAFQRGDACGYNIYDKLYKAALVEERKEANGEFNIFTSLAR